MALPAGTLSSCKNCIELTTNGTTWVDFSDYLTVIAPDAWTRVSGTMHTFGPDYPINTTGKLNAIQVRIRGVYADTTATTNPFSYVYAQHTATCGGALGVRYAPNGCSTASQVFSTATATGHTSKIIELVLPPPDASSGDPLVWEALVEAPTWVKATYV